LQKLEDKSNEKETHLPFDQFEENKLRFGTKSSYDFNKYTTVIDESKITDELRLKADLIESQVKVEEIIGDNEERMHSSVIREE